jgi:hypothetical protein
LGFGADVSVEELPPGWRWWGGLNGLLARLPRSNGFADLVDFGSGIAGPGRIPCTEIRLWQYSFSRSVRLWLAAVADPGDDDGVITPSRVLPVDLGYRTLVAQVRWLTTTLAGDDVLSLVERELAQLAARALGDP